MNHSVIRGVFVRENCGHNIVALTFRQFVPIIKNCFNHTLLFFALFGTEHWFRSRYVTLEHKSSVKTLGYIYNNSQKYIVWVKIIDFTFTPKIIRILRSCSMKIFCIVNISKLNYWLLICIAKNFIWTTLKMIFSIFRFFCTLRFQIFKYCPIITNHTSMEILFIQLLYDAYISILKNGHLCLVLCSRVTYDREVWTV